MEQNVQLQLAAEFMHNTDKNIFLTGKAGTGKTTFLHNLKKTLHKRMAIVAPTGVAAINAGGVTIHSFFQLPFGPHIPDSFMETQSVHKFSKERINLIKSLDLLVIDEISMVRADLLDGMDAVLRRYKNKSKPFGGIQLLMIGDLHQLAPVVKDDEWSLLQDHYNTMYFFGSHALQKTNPIRIELTKIYRQSDTLFIDLLNKVRENKLDTASLAILNQRYDPDFKPTDEEGYITLTTHNTYAQSINIGKLDELKSKSRTFIAETYGDFPASAYPTEQSLVLKEGAQVMFVKNDISREKLFYNGKIGQITRIASDIIYVQCKGEYEEIEVEKMEWQNVKYALNETTKEVEEQVIGGFKQYPLKLAWAITIHKSQGLTFEKAIIDAQSAFAPGQVYVALSRCKTFEGMVLKTRIEPFSVKTDKDVARYSEDANNNPPDEFQLENAKSDFQRSLIYELFNFFEIQRALLALKRTLSEHANVLNPYIIEQTDKMYEPFEKEILEIGSKFTNQLNNLFSENILPQENPLFVERFEKAIPYFTEKMEVIFGEAQDLNIETDNAEIKKTATNVLENFQKAIFIKNACLKSLLQGFNTNEYLKARANADIDFKADKKRPSSTKSVPKNMPHGQLYASLIIWRKEMAAKYNVLDYEVVRQKVLLDILETLPTTAQQLSKVKGIGKVKIKQFGDSLLQVITEYLKKNDIEIPENEQSIVAKSDLPDTKKTSLELFLKGNSIQEVAKQRGLTIGTIEGHLITFIGTDELSITTLYPAEKVQVIEDFLRTQQPNSLNEAKAGLGDDYSFTEIKAVWKHISATDQ